MITQRHIRGFKARYHRNGVAGEGFFVCRFIYLNGKQHEQMQAVVFDTDSEAPTGRCAVTSALLDERWRGDDFEPAIRAALAAVQRAQPDILYSVGLK